ncbi:hypothetical protein BCON_0461g00040 [Botryotinia convoluta]|uniref:Uncharacterized protein n=1 Tax=Botryotinia convoluta TaxID=54673 RepID=A0A4Z1HHW7_9HELO|nr:hypothetical protein BCON_0461g00040 [Botryotinia convoluta]
MTMVFEITDFNGSSSELINMDKSLRATAIPDPLPGNHENSRKCDYTQGDFLDIESCSRIESGEIMRPLLQQDYHKHH